MSKVENDAGVSIMKTEIQYDNYETTAEVLFNDNVRYNAKLAKIKTRLRKKCPITKSKPALPQPAVGLTPSEVQDELKQAGCSVSERTLRYYAQRGLITPPQTFNLGRGVGKKAFYDRVVVTEIKNLKTQR